MGESEGWKVLGVFIGKGEDLSEKERFCRERRGFAGKGEVLQINLRIFAKLMEEALNRGPLRSKDL